MDGPLKISLQNGLLYLKQLKLLPIVVRWVKCSIMPIVIGMNTLKRHTQNASWNIPRFYLMNNKIHTT